ncbi:hypothetical protein NLG97_g4678 [Lecanicillium saksenae]|uniref:Uncharacterized protein n=1 Tax=Lecanicillium saksenae TaxID=468837 RepID=A0ACC1QUM1_9HYPO|nr:hypothetical protein NLG97_g4678 [Lecanicillium saksenae]
MGIPHLISTLEPYVQHVALKDVDVVVDGPGLAHHVLHVCRVNGVDHPSYQLLGKTAAAWLDRLAAQNAVIKKIYFDGYLPKSKLPVRMQRAVKSTSQLASFCGYNRRGCPRCHIIEPTGAVSIDPFKTGRPENKPLEAPSFLVPAVIEALRRSKKYKSTIQVVPGEADGYCAKAAVEDGGIVITSDSDLLVHDLGSGGVALLRNIYQDDAGAVQAAVYFPREIFRTLGLSTAAEICRFAYERSCSAHTTTPMLIQACSQPVKDEKGYEEFCIQYKEEERAQLPMFSSGGSLALQGLDPRWSELLLQISQPESPDGTVNIFRMFLPVLIDSSEKGTAWENSRYIRQLAYSLARHMLPGTSGSVHEYRRVQTIDQGGRQVIMLPSPSIHSELRDIADTLDRISRLLSGKRDTLYWLLAYIVLDIRGAAADARSLFVVDVLQQAKWPGENAETIPWTLVHFVAHMQAAYYSLRMLAQLIHASVADARRVAGSSFSKLAQMLEDFPLLEASPDARSVSKLIRTAPVGKMDGILAHFVELPKPAAAINKSARRMKKAKNDGSITKKPVKSAAASNMFGLLPME